MPQILAELVRVGIVDSVAGPGGGYVLARRPADIDAGLEAGTYTVPEPLQPDPGAS